MGFLSTYRKIKGIWMRPKFKVFFGLWKNNGATLPVCKGGCIRLAKYGQYYWVRKSVEIEDKSKTTYDFQGRPIRYFYHTKHNIKPDYAWNRNIRKKLRKWGLGWLPPIIETPWWLKVAVYNMDVQWKTKYNEVRYEFPPQFTFVFFGLCLTITLHEPTGGKYTSDDTYWEGILDYLYKYNGDMYKTAYYGGVWSNSTLNEKWFSVRPEHILRVDDYCAYLRGIAHYRAKHPDEKIV